MKRLIAILGILICFCTASYSQSFDKERLETLIIKGQFEAALTECIATGEKVQEPEPWVIDMFCLMARACEGLGGFKDAAEIYESGLEFLLEDTAGSTTQKAEYIYHMTSFYNSINHELDAVNTANIGIKIIGEFINEVAKNINSDTVREMNKALVSMHKIYSSISLACNDFVSTISSINDAIKAHEENGGGIDMDLIDLTILNGVSHEGINEYKKAIGFYEKALGMLSAMGLEKSIPAANINYYLGRTYNSLGNTQKAIYHYEISGILFEEELKATQHLNYGNLLVGLSRLANRVNDYESAMTFVEAAMDYFDNHFSDKEQIIIDCKLAYIDILNNKGEYSDAFDVLEAAMDMNWDTSMSNNSVVLFKYVGDIYMGIEEYDFAQYMYKSSLDLHSTLERKDKMELRPLYLALGKSYLKGNKRDSSLIYYKNLLDVEKEMVHDVFSFLPEADRISYWNTCGEYIDGLHEISAQDGIAAYPETAEILYDIALLNKGILLESSISLGQMIEESGDEGLQKDFMELQKTKQRLSTINGMAAQNDPELIPALEKRSKELEAKVMEASLNYGDFMDFSKISWAHIKEAMKEDEVAIEFISTERDSLVHYSAELIRKSYGSPKHIALFSMSPEECKTLSTKNIYSDLTISNLIWKNILPHVKDGETIYFSPAGELHNISIEYVMLPDGERLCDKYAPVRLSSTREIAKGLDNGVKAGDAVLYGGLNYNTSISEMDFIASSYNETRGGSFRTPWPYLRGTEIEVRNINGTLTEKGYKTSSFMNDEGVEESFKALSGKGSDIIHIATHGFYIEEDLFAPQEEYLSAEDKVLMRSGLILSGGNNFWTGGLTEEGTEIEDGILSAREIARMDLRGTEMVVLSACQTGLGDVTGEGVFGLQRGFKKAGVQTLLVSLWSVNDEATQVMMEAFYKGLCSGMEKREALRNAQKTVRATKFSNGTVSGDDPSLWAGFVMID